MVNAAYRTPGRSQIYQLYVFFGGRYLKIKLDGNLNDTFVNRGSHSILSGRKSLEKADFDAVDAALVVPGTTNQVYFFRDSNYVRVDNFRDEIINGPSLISKGWPSLVEAGFDIVDAIVASPGGGDVYYVFCGVKYVRIKVDSSRGGRLNLSARLISSRWKTLDGWA